MGILDAILNRPGKLTPDEYRIMQTHAAMANCRVYREAMEMGEVRQVIREGRGVHFDPDLVDIF